MASLSSSSLFDTYEQEYCELAHQIKHTLKNIATDVDAHDSDANNNNAFAHLHHDYDDDADDVDDDFGLVDGIDMELGIVSASEKSRSSTKQTASWDSLEAIKERLLRLDKHLQIAANNVKNMEMELHANSVLHGDDLSFSGGASTSIDSDAHERLKQYKRDLRDMKAKYEQAMRRVLLSAHNRASLEYDNHYGYVDDDDDDDGAMYEYGRKGRYSSEYRRKMMESTGLLQKGQESLQNILRMANETENTAVDSLADLGRQRETLERTVNRVCLVIMPLSVRNATYRFSDSMILPSFPCTRSPTLTERSLSCEGFSHPWNGKASKCISQFGEPWHFLCSVLFSRSTSL